MVMGSPSTQESSPRGPRVTTRAESRNSGTWDELALENVSMTFNPGKPNEYRALANTTIKVRRSEFYCLLGPSGCGKSTVLNLIAGFAVPSSGKIRIGERQVVEAGTDRVVVFQDATNALFPWLRTHETWNLGYRFKEFRNEKQRNEPQNIWISLDCGITHGNIHMNYPGE